MSALHPALVAVWRAIRPSLSDAEAREVIATVKGRAVVNERGAFELVRDGTEDARALAKLVRPTDPDGAHRAIIAAFASWVKGSPVSAFFDWCPGCDACEGAVPHVFSRIEGALSRLGVREFAWCMLALIEEAKESLAAAKCEEAHELEAALRRFARGEDEWRATSSVRAAVAFCEEVRESARDLEAADALDIERALWLVSESVLCVFAFEETAVGARFEYLDGRSGPFVPPPPESPVLSFSLAQWGAGPTLEQAAIIRDIIADALLSFPMPADRRGDPSRHDH